MFYLPAALSLALLLLSFYKAGWSQLWACSMRLHMAFGSGLSLALAWKFLAFSINDVFILALGFVVSLSLIFGFYFSLIIGALALIFLHLISPLPWQNIAFHFVVCVVVPASLASSLLRLLEKTPGLNLFFYTLGLGFVAAMLASLATGISALAIFYALNSTLYWPAWDHREYFFLLAFPQGFCNGMLISALAIWRPDLLKTFDEKRWLDQK